MARDKAKDARKHPFFIVDNVVIDRHAKRMGAYGVAIYAVIVRHAKDGQAFPSKASIADILGCGVRTVDRSIDTMCEIGLIKKEQRRTLAGDPDSNLYTVLDLDGTATQTVPTATQTVGVPPEGRGGTASVAHKQDLSNKTNQEQEPESNDSADAPNDGASRPSPSHPTAAPQESSAPTAEHSSLVSPPALESPAAELDADTPSALPAQPKRSARNGKANGKANANGAEPAQPDSGRAAESKAVFGELCEWLGLDWQKLPKNTRGRLNTTAANILDAGLGADAVARARDAWRRDWRAKGGRTPEIGMIEDLVARAGAGIATATNGSLPRYGVHDAPARVKMSEVF